MIAFPTTLPNGLVQTLVEKDKNPSAVTLSHNEYLGITHGDFVQMSNEAPILFDLKGTYIPASIDKMMVK